MTLRYLVDTHVLIWYFSRDKRLRLNVALALENELDLHAVSVASVWEAEIKQAAGRLNPPTSFHETVRLAGFPIIDVTPKDAVTAAHLPPFHRDPFDRMIVAHAQSRGLTLITADDAVLNYSVAVLWAGA